MGYLPGILFVERQDVVDVGFHFSSSYQHEVQYEDQYKQVDGKTADASHHCLPYLGKQGDDE